MQAVQAVQPGRGRILRPVLGSPGGGQGPSRNLQDMLPPALHGEVLPRVRGGQEESGEQSEGDYRNWRYKYPVRV